MNGHNNGWRSVGPHSDFDSRGPISTHSASSPMVKFLRGEIDGRLTRIDDLLRFGNAVAARAMIEGWVKELRAGEWPDWLR